MFNIHCKHMPLLGLAPCRVLGVLRFCIKHSTCCLQVHKRHQCMWQMAGLAGAVCTVCMDFSDRSPVCCALLPPQTEKVLRQRLAGAQSQVNELQDKQVQLLKTKHELEAALQAEREKMGHGNTVPELKLMVATLQKELELAQVHLKKNQVGRWWRTVSCGLTTDHMLARMLCPDALSTTQRPQPTCFDQNPHALTTCVDHRPRTTCCAQPCQRQALMQCHTSAMMDLDSTA